MSLQIREDQPGYLSSRPENYCKRDGCMVRGTDVLRTGAIVMATCQTLGARTTNGEDANPVDDADPERYESRPWYGVRWTEGRFGFLSEVWVHPDDRGASVCPCTDLAAQRVSRERPLVLTQRRAAVRATAV